MPIGHYRPWRATVVERLSPWLTQSYWSMVSRGEFLPGTRSGKRMDHRHHEPDWFDHTHFSVVCESARTWEAAVTFLTEKTYKAIAGWHPFMLIGAPGLLAMLREQGFETFDNCFDESYDKVAELDLKLDIVIDNIKRYRYGSVDPETQRRILHNRMLFYNTRRVKQGLIQDVLDPISHYINSESTG